MSSYDHKDPKQSCHAWDDAADKLIPDWENKFGGRAQAERALGFERPFGPSRVPSTSCESGKRPYCTCDTCF